MKCTVLFVVFCLFFGVFWDFHSLVLLFLFLLFCLLYDLYGFIKGLLLICVGKIRRTINPRKLTDSHERKVFCLPTDCNIQLCLTQCRLLAECETARWQMWIENFVTEALGDKEAKMYPEGLYFSWENHIRVFESYKILSKVVFWDRDRLYVEQTLIRHADKVRCARVFTVHRLVGTTVDELLGKFNNNIDFLKPRPTDLVEHFRKIHKDKFIHLDI